jgi:hypothetical protein
LEIPQQNKLIMSMLNTDVAITVFSVVIFGLCALILILNRLREKKALQAQVEEAVASQESKEERRRERKETLSKGLIVKEWMPDADPPPSVESTEGAKDTPPSGDAIEAPQSAPARPIISSPASCAMGSDDEEMAGCAIMLKSLQASTTCLRIQQLVIMPTHLP